MINNYFDKQPVFCNYIEMIAKNDKISHAFLIETNGVSYSYDLALSMVKYFLTFNVDIEKRNKIFKLIDSGNYPDFKVIDSDSIIKKEEILNLQQDFSTMPIYGKYMIYLINNASKLNVSARNTLLKFLEEPASNIIAILLINNTYDIDETIVSRCQILSLIPEKSDINKCINSFFDNIDEVNSYIDSCLNYYLNITLLKKDFLLTDYVYKYRDSLLAFLNIGFYYYSDMFNMLMDKNLVYFLDYLSFFQDNMKYYDINDIIKKINILNKFLFNLGLNVNKDLFIDNLVISLIGGE